MRDIIIVVIVVILRFCHLVKGWEKSIILVSFFLFLSFLSLNQVKLSFLSFGSWAAVAPALSSAVARSFHR